MFEVWKTDSQDDPYRLSSVGTKTIEDFEKSLKRRLPEEYKDLIRKQNGGRITHNSVNVGEFSDEDDLEIDHIYGLGSPGLLDSSYIIKEWGLPKNILIFNGEGNDWFALDYSTEIPAVIYIEWDSEEIIKAASSFGDFIKNLTNKELISANEEDEWTWTKEEAEAIL
ncbi:SMI1/KNR4 family protein [Halobacillus sp. K22]|uniref:SMI1/KNR4 family protein n=1 Tax=Halobacillus sp. K22 TaxID=3457431 RepID=UPI003FCD7D06